MAEPKPEVTKLNVGDPPVDPPSTNVGDPPASGVTPKSVETPPAEAMHKIVVDGKEEELPLSKVIEFAQQGRHYAQEKGEFNKRVDDAAQKRIDTWWAEVQAETERLEAEKKTAAEKVNYDGLSPEEQQAADIKYLKQRDVEREEQGKEAELEETIVVEQGKIEEALTQAKKDFPLMDEDKILAILQATDKFSLGDIKTLAERTHKQELDRQAAWEKDYLAKGKVRNKAGAEGGGGGTHPLAPTKLKLGVNTRQAVADFWAKREGS